MALTNDEAKKRLQELLERRKNYFLLEGIQRKLYQAQFEKIQREIIHLKLCLELYHDELDLFSVVFNYVTAEAKDIREILQDAHHNREVRWLKKIYDPSTWMAEYVGQVLQDITNFWLKERYEEHCLKREGYIDCPWPTILGEKDGGNSVT